MLAYTPADSVAYAELRLDLPGSQSAELAKVMKAFPGFEDQAAFPMKLSEALDLLVGQATDGQQGYKNDIEPWFGGQIGVSVGPLPTTADPAAARAVALLSVKDAAKATAWADGVAAKSGAATTTETYNGVTITVAEPAAGAGADAKGMKAAYAVVGPVLAIGDPTSVKAVIDTGGKTGLNTNAQFQEAEASVTGDRLGFAYVDLATLAKSATDLAGDGHRRHAVAADLARGPGPRRGSRAPSAPRTARSSWRAARRTWRRPGRRPTPSPSCRASCRRPPCSSPRATTWARPSPRSRTSSPRSPSSRSPSSSWTTRSRSSAAPRRSPAGSARPGVAVTLDGKDVAGGLVIVPNDAAAADKLLSQLKAFIQLGGAQAGLSVTEEDYNGDHDHRRSTCRASPAWRAT